MVKSQLTRRLTASILRLQMRSPFFATLALFTQIHFTETVETAATNGKDIFINPQFAEPLTPPAFDGLLLHEVLHAALLHLLRRQSRDRLLWNIAADIVVNGMIAQQKDLEIPKGAIRDQTLEHLSVEEIYEILQKQSQTWVCTLLDLQDSQDDCVNPSTLEAYWRDAMQQAIAIAHSSQSQGSIPSAFQREISHLTQPQIDWRAYLWRYLVKTPTDFTGFDRRFISRKLYLETLEGESVKVYVAIDTSGSISDRELQLFLSELLGILRSYPHLECELYYADATIYGPIELKANQNLPQPIGGGGTSFIPFFEKVNQSHCFYQSGICVYLTDGYGTFPQIPPSLPVLWVVTPGGLDLNQFPFGESVRLLSAI